MKVIPTVVLIFILCTVVSCVQTIEAPVNKYEGPRPQTPETILEAFKDVPSKWLRRSYEKYPATKWFQILIDKGIVIEDSDDFDQYLMLRERLIQEERRYLSEPDMWLPKKYFGKTYNSWETYKDAFIDRKIWEYQQIKTAKQADPSVYRVKFLGPDGRTVLPLPEKSVVIKRVHRGYAGNRGTSSNAKLSEQQMFDIVYKGKHPRGWKVVYIDNMSNILPERPTPISREELGLPPDVPWPPKSRAHLERIFEEVKQGRYNNYNNFGDN